MFIATVGIQSNLFQHIFGSSRISEVINSVIVIFALYLVTLFVILPIVRLVLDALDYRRLRERQTVCLELTPPAVNTKTLLATAQWYNSIHGLLSRSSRKERLLHRKKILPLEIVNSRSEGIRFIARLDPRNVDIFEQLLVSYLPDVRFQEIDDYLPADTMGRNIQVMDFAQTGHFSASMSVVSQLNQHDPIAYITGAMTQPLPDELIAFQLILSPASRRVANRVRLQLLHGKDTTTRHKWWHWPFLLLFVVIKAIFAIFGSLLEMLSGELTGIRTPPQKYQPSPQYNISPVTQHVLDSTHHKLDQPLFSVDIRALVIGSGSQQRAQSLANSLHQFHVPGFQGFTARRNFPKRWVKPYRISSFYKRLPAMFTMNSNVLAADEVASLYHFPYGKTSSTENVVKSYSKSLPAPAVMKARADQSNFDVVLGANLHHGLVTSIGLTAAERERHVYVVGGTGNGKTTMLEGAIVQDIRTGKGVAVIDPHGDLAQELLGYIPKDRIKDVIYFNPYDISHPIGLNLLELPKNLSPDDLAHQKEFLTEAIISVFRKVFSEDDTGGHRIESILRNTIHTAFTVPDATLFTLYDLLTDPDFRKGVVSKLEDKRLKQFWDNQFAKAGNMQMVKMISGVTTKLERFDRSESVRRVIEQPKSTINFDDIMNEGKILICNFARGTIGDDTSELFGIAIMAQLQLAAQRRIHIKPKERKPFYLYVDEFQNFATLTFVELLAEARKFKLYLTMAEQSTAQQEEQRIVHIILDNVGTIICFRFGSPESERLLLPLFQPYVDVGEISKLSSFNFYMSVRALTTQEPFSGETVPLGFEGDEDIAEQVVVASRQQYATVYEPPKLEKPKAAQPTNRNKVTKKSGMNRKAVGRRRKSRAKV